MAFITREYYQELQNNDMIERNDYTKLAAISREVGLKKGKGYSRQSFRNVIENAFTTTPEVVQIIVEYYRPKIEALHKQRESVKEMKEKLSHA